MLRIAKTMAARPTISITLVSMLLIVAVGITKVAGDDSKNTGSSNGKPRARDLVAEVCKNMSDGFLESKTHFDEKPCISVLRSDNRSAVAKDHGDLVIVAFDLLEHRSRQIAAKIDSILHGLTVRNWTERSFRFCAADYADILIALPVCRDIFLDLKPLGTKAKQIDALGALGCLDRLGIGARECCLGLSNHWDYEKTKEFFDVIRHISLTWGLMEMATNFLDGQSQCCGQRWQRRCSLRFQGSAAAAAPSPAVLGWHMETSLTAFRG
ncbi:hypothetical protein ACP70R_023567 [Stipagrostis hirtigluma subsp. patula]